MRTDRPQCLRGDGGHGLAEVDREALLENDDKVAGEFDAMLAARQKLAGVVGEAG